MLQPLKLRSEQGGWWWVDWGWLICRRGSCLHSNHHALYYYSCPLAHYCPTNVLVELVDQRAVVQQVLKSKRRSSNKSAGNQLLGTFKCNQGFNFDLAFDAAEWINKYSTVANTQNFSRVSGLLSFCGFHPNLQCVAGVILGI